MEWLLNTKCIVEIQCVDSEFFLSRLAETGVHAENIISIKPLGCVLR